MIAPEDPPSFIIRTEAQKAAADNGFRLPRGGENGWLRFGSTTAQGDVWIAGASPTGPWLLALDRAEVAAEIGAAETALATGPGAAIFVFDTLPPLYAALDRAYRLSVSLPNAPLMRFEVVAENLPRTTEAERLVIQRVGQDVFRQALMAYWGGRCPLTGITDPALLRASHIIPWAECETDAERLDVHNGLLLSALWDAAFDRALVTFNDHGEPEFSPDLSDQARAELRWSTPIALTDNHRRRLTRHRERARAEKFQTGQ
ncbi:hypothetical protein ACOSOMT5_P1025 [Acidiphilium sp. MT5]